MPTFKLSTRFLATGLGYTMEKLEKLIVVLPIVFLRLY